MSRLEQIYIHLPAGEIVKRLPLFIELGWSPEIALQTRDLDQRPEADRIRKTLERAGLGCCVHAPFFDLNPASNDPQIAAITAHRYDQTLEVAAELGASHVVFHPGYDPWRYARAPQAWLEYSLRFWPPFIRRAEELGIVLCLENIFDTDPQPLVDLLGEFDAPHLRHCFDIGHWFLFSKTTIGEWLDLFAPYLYHLHLHDNRGKRDDHRPIGNGKIDFVSFFNQLDRLRLSPRATLEAHRQKDAEKSLAALQKYL